MQAPTPKAQLLTDLEKVFAGEPWFGDSALTILESVSPQPARTPVAGRRIYSLFCICWFHAGLSPLPF